MKKLWFLIALLIPSFGFAALDTTDFDNKIAEKNQGVTTIQTELDNDPDQIKLKALQQKATDMQVLLIERSDLESKKAKAIALQATIEANQAELDVLLNEVK